MKTRFVSVAAISFQLLVSPVFAEVAPVYQAQADAEFHAQQAQNDAHLQQMAVSSGTAIVVNDLDTGATQVFGTPEAIAAREQRIQGEFVLPDGTTAYHPGGAAGALADHQRGVAEMQKVWDEQKKAIQGMTADDPSSPQAQEAIQQVDVIKRGIEADAKRQEERLRNAKPKTLVSYEKDKNTDFSSVK